jgi:hypothetical protein
MGDGVPLSLALLPLPPVAKVMGKTGKSGCNHPTRVPSDQFFIYSF